MSIYQFIASNEPFDNLENPYLESLSIREALERNLEIPDFMVENPDLDPEEKIVLLCDTEEHMNELEITPQTELSFSELSGYSEKSSFAGIHWVYTKERALKLLDYLQDHLKRSPEVEIFSIWLDDQSPLDVRTLSSEALTLESLSFLDLSPGYGGPVCLRITSS